MISVANLVRLKSSPRELLENGVPKEINSLYCLSIRKTHANRLKVLEFVILGVVVARCSQIQIKAKAGKSDHASVANLVRLSDVEPPTASDRAPP
jgi:hypothetical protein